MDEQERLIPLVGEAVAGLSADERESLALLVSLGAAVLMDATTDDEHSEIAREDLALALPVLWALAPDEAVQAERLLAPPLGEGLIQSLPDGLVTVTADAVEHAQALLLGYGLVLDDEQVRDGIACWLLGHSFLAHVAAVDSAVVGEPWVRAVLQDELGLDLVALPFTARYSAAATAAGGDASG
jgi:hypothetical protein